MRQDGVQQQHFSLWSFRGAEGRAVPVGSGDAVREFQARGRKEWHAEAPGRKLLILLLILRPALIFGLGEGGNVTRLIRSLVKGYFFYMGNGKTRKVGGCVWEAV
jgi:hypothetical protein